MTRLIDRVKSLESVVSELSEALEHQFNINADYVCYIERLNKNPFPWTALFSILLLPILALLYTVPDPEYVSVVSAHAIVSFSLATDYYSVAIACYDVALSLVITFIYGVDGIVTLPHFGDVFIAIEKYRYITVLVYIGFLVGTWLSILSYLCSRPVLKPNYSSKPVLSSVVTDWVSFIENNDTFDDEEDVSMGNGQVVKDIPLENNDSSDVNVIMVVDESFESSKHSVTITNTVHDNTTYTSSSPSLPSTHNLPKPYPLKSGDVVANTISRSPISSPVSAHSSPSVYNSVYNSDSVVSTVNNSINGGNEAMETQGVGSVSENEDIEVSEDVEDLEEDFEHDDPILNTLDAVEYFHSQHAYIKAANLTIEVMNIVGLNEPRLMLSYAHSLYLSAVYDSPEYEQPEVEEPKLEDDGGMTKRGKIDTALLYVERVVDLFSISVSSQGVSFDSAKTLSDSDLQTVHECFKWLANLSYEKLHLPPVVGEDGCESEQESESLDRYASYVEAALKLLPPESILWRHEEVLD